MGLYARDHRACYWCGEPASGRRLCDWCTRMEQRIAYERLVLSMSHNTVVRKGPRGLLYRLALYCRLLLLYPRYVGLVPLQVLHPPHPYTELLQSPSSIVPCAQAGEPLHHLYRDAQPVAVPMPEA